MKNYEFVYAEITFSPDKMQNFPESASPWFVLHADGDAERETVMDEMMALVKTMTKCLTSRQKEVMRLHYYEQHTQVEIAKILGISQATVNHHLIGKMKRGKSVGGAIQKMRKSIRKKAEECEDQNVRRNQLITVLNNMLDMTSTRRKTACRLRNLFRLLKRASATIV